MSQIESIKRDFKHIAKKFAWMFLVLGMLSNCSPEDAATQGSASISPEQPRPLSDLDVFQHYTYPFRAERVQKAFAPGAGGEILLGLVENSVLLYQWSVDGGPVHSDLHGHKSDDSHYWVQYRLDDASVADYGSIVAPFDGKHGWYFRNDGNEEVLVSLRVTGYFSDIEY